MSPLYLPYISPYLAPLHLEVALLQCGAHMLLVGLLLGLEGVLRVDLLLLEQHQAGGGDAAVALADQLGRRVEAVHQPAHLGAVLAEILDEDLGDALGDPVELREAWRGLGVGVGVGMR